MSPCSVPINPALKTDTDMKHLSNVIEECSDIRDNKLISADFEAENIKEYINIRKT